MTSEEAPLLVVDALESLQIPWMFVGSLASNFHGIARSTQDADFVVQMSPERIREVADVLGPAFKLDPQMSFETVTMTMRHVLSVPDVPFKIEVFYLSDEDFDQERFRRRIRVPSQGREVVVMTAEDVIVTKLRWIGLAKRNKDWDDVRNVIAVQGAEAIDWTYVHAWCDRHGTRALLDEIRASIPVI